MVASADTIPVLTRQAQLAKPSLFQQYVYLSRYSRFLHDEGRRETWPETVARYFDFFAGHLRVKHGYQLLPELRAELESAVLGMEVMPSMRCLMTAGPALERSNMACYNCSFTVIDSPRSWAEILAVLMDGTGVGFSVERQYISKLPEVPDELYETDTVIVVADSKIGWARALLDLTQLLYSGNVPKWDLSRVRPAGSVLKTFGGRASGPDPLDSLFRFFVDTFKRARGRRLTSLECHDLACMVGNSVVVGGVRRSALISLSNLSDDRMRAAKTGQWWETTPYRRLANNSAVYDDERPETGTFMTEWKSLYDSKSGERGIFSRYAARRVIERANAFRRQYIGEDARLRDPDHEWGTNPCSEIVLRDKQTCNLSEVVVRASDTLDDLRRKVRLAAILGTFQSTLTDFKFVSRRWSANVEDERLLGVSLTGIMDNKLTSGQTGLEKLKEALTTLRVEATRANMDMAERVGIPPAAAVTCVKPSGTVSSLVDSASGIHPRHAEYYVRTARSDTKDPLTQLMSQLGFPNEPDVMSPDHTTVFSFPFKSPTGAALFRKDVDAIRQLELWKTYQMYWCDHKPSVTVSVRENEWMDVGAWVFRNFEWMSGLSFLPMSDHVYAQAPYQDCTAEQYEELQARMPRGVDWSDLRFYEKTDTTTSSQELACSASGGCDIS